MSTILFFSMVGYVLAAYGFANMVVYANGPFHIFSQWREFSMNLNEKFGELFTCMICISTWIGLFFSLIDICIVKETVFTPFNIILYDKGHEWLVVFLDMMFTSGCVWVLHQFEEMLERIGVYGTDE